MTPVARIGLVLLYLVLCASPCWSQQILVDRGTRAAGLWCFPLAGNEKEYLYLPADGHLGVDKSGGPEFSFIRYVEPQKKTGDSPSSITEAAGGAVLHFLALYETPQKQVDAAQKALKEITADEEVKLRGPVVFTSGRYIIVSSLARSESGGEKLVITGNAPVLEGSKIAVSVELDKRDAQLLYNSFQMANPDISIAFEMEFEGLNDAYDATLDVDWSEVRQDEQIGGGVKFFWIGAEVDKVFQRLTRNNAVKLTTRGEHAASEALLNTVYSKLLDMLYRKVEEPAPPEQKDNGLGLLGKLVGGTVGKAFGFSLSATYKLKEIQTSGHTVMNFNHQAGSRRTTFITFNIGDLYKRYGTNADCFKAVNLSDPIYSQREVLVSVDGSLLADFDKYINSVTVTLRKQHEDGAETLGEVVVDRKTFNENVNRFSFVYGWSGDKDRTKWLDYDYRVKWSFVDGGSYVEDWRATNSPMVVVVPPYERREILIEGDSEAMKKAGVKYALVKLAYDFFGKPRIKQVRAKVGDAAISDTLQLIQPKGKYKYRYEVKWFMADQRELVKPETTDTSGLIFIDELPGE